jgi:hypothetical protein
MDARGHRQSRSLGPGCGRSRPFWKLARFVRDGVRSELSQYRLTCSVDGAEVPGEIVRDNERVTILWNRHAEKKTFTAEEDHELVNCVLVRIGGAVAAVALVD